MSKIGLKIKYNIQVFMQDFFSTKLLVIMILQIFILHVFLNPLKEFSKVVNYSVTPFIMPFLMSNEMFKIFFMASIIYYYSNVPFMQYTQMYNIIRTGRKKWALGKIISIIFGAFGLSVIETILSIIPLIGRMKFNLEWGKVMYTLSLTDAAEQYKIPLNISNKVLNSYNPLSAMVIILLISTLVISFIGVLMFAVSIFSTRLSAMSIATFLNILPIIDINIHTKCKWLIYISPISWMSLELIGEKSGGEFPPISYIITILIVAIIILIVLIICKVKTINFDWNKEE